jgi:hypothetical protein
MAEKNTPKKVKVGTVVALKKVGFVQLPDGSVVSAIGGYCLNQPGEHVIEGVTYEAVEA